MFIYCKIMTIDLEDKDMTELGISPTVIWANTAISIPDINLFLESFDDDNNISGTMVRTFDGTEYETNLSFSTVKKKVEAFYNSTEPPTWLIKTLN
jgi:hypothetical protein|tara:strand:- start:1463 stop:1750 length:288 start_codon:yes stop_codon:yes gene_type:complete